MAEFSSGTEFNNQAMTMSLIRIQDFKRSESVPDGLAIEPSTNSNLVLDGQGGQHRSTPRSVVILSPVSN